MTEKLENAVISTRKRPVQCRVWVVENVNQCFQRGVKTTDLQFDNIKLVNASNSIWKTGFTYHEK